MYYCGNNRLDPKVLRGQPIGDRYVCLKQGFGKGRTLEPYEPGARYEPIVEEKFYCGLKKLPGEYERYGTNVECFRKGVGIGKLSSSALRVVPRRQNRRQNGRLFSFILLATILILTIVVIVRINV